MSISLAAAPGGSRVGIVAGLGPSGQVLVTVAPKTWRVGAARQHMVESWPSGHTDITLYETDRLHVRAPEPWVEEMFSSILRRSLASADGEQQNWESTLLAPDVAPASWRPSTWSSATDVLSETANLLRLFQHVKLTTAPTTELSGRAARSPLHRPLAVRHFLDEVELRTAQARRGYRRVREERVSVRGRVAATSIARFASTGIPTLTCVYDELTESTELLGVVCAALEGIAEGRGVRSVFAIVGYDERTLRSDAVRLRRAMAEVRALTPAEALRVGRRLRLSRLDRPWATALRLALVLLSGMEILAAESRHRDFQADELSAESSKIWEWIVNAVLVRMGFDAVHQQGLSQASFNEDPWKRHPLGVAPSPNTNPDNIAVRATKVFIVDAKYKPPPPIPSRGDQYQMFAYSHLVRSEGREVAAAVLVYPGGGPATEWIRGRDPSPDPVKLFAAEVPFPQPADLMTASRWDQYLSRAARALQSDLRFVQSRIEGAV